MPASRKTRSFVFRLSLLFEEEEEEEEEEALIHSLFSDWKDPSLNRFTLLVISDITSLSLPVCLSLRFFKSIGCLPRALSVSLSASL